MLKSVYIFQTYDFPDASNRRTEDRPNGKITYLTGQQLKAELGPLIDGLVAAQRNLFQATERPPSFKGFRPYYNDEKDIPPPARLLRMEKPVKPFNKDFKRRSAAGEIVVSNYHNWTALITYKNGKVVEHVDPPIFNIWNCTAVQGVPQRENRYVIYNGYKYECRIRIFHALTVYSSPVTPYQVGWRDPLPYNLDHLSHTIHGDNVQSTLADHNTRVIDVLTAMAEMPETLRSIIEACKTVIRMYGEVKRKEFRLQNQVAEWKNAKTSDKNRRQIIRNIRELQDAISSLWLNYRYNIKPTIGLIEDSLKVLASDPDTQFIRDRDRVIIPFDFHPVDNWESNKQLDMTHRVMIKSRLTGGNAKNFNAFLSANPLLTAYELIPLSFVLDWFINVGDFIAALSPSANAGQGATYSWKCDDTIVYTHDSGAEVSIKFNWYKRQVIDPAHYCGLYWSPNVNLVRQFDALALIWKIFISNKVKTLS